MASIWIATLRDMDMWEEAQEFEAKMSGDSPAAQVSPVNGKTNIRAPGGTIRIRPSQNSVHWVSHSSKVQCWFPMVAHVCGL